MNRTEDPEQYWFLCLVMWTIRKATDDDIKKGQLETNIWGHVLDWYMKFIQVPIGTPAKTLDEVKRGMIEELWKTKFEAQYITELREIKKFINEIVLEFDQIFKTLMARFSFNMSDVQHKEWFIATLVPHIWKPLM